MKKINSFTAVLLLFLLSCGQSDNSKFDEIAKRWMDARRGTPDMTTAMRNACDWEKINRNNLDGSFRIDDSIYGGPFDRREMYDKLNETMNNLKKSMSNFYRCN